MRNCCDSFAKYVREQLTARNLVVSFTLSLSIVGLVMFWAIIVFDNAFNWDNVLFAALAGKLPVHIVSHSLILCVQYYKIYNIRVNGVKLKF